MFIVFDHFFVLSEKYNCIDIKINNVKKQRYALVIFQGKKERICLVATIINMKQYVRIFINPTISLLYDIRNELALSRSF